MEMLVLDWALRSRDTLAMHLFLRSTLIAGLFLGSALAAGESKTEPAKESAAASGDSAAVLVQVDEKPITEGDLAFFMLVRNAPDEQTPEVRRRFLDQLIDRRIMQGYLAVRKAEADKLELDAQVARIRRTITKQGDDPDELLKRLGLNEQSLRAELSLPLAWQAYLGRVVTPESVREYFAKHRRKFDGTELRASQIFLKLDEPHSEEQRKVALEKLAHIRAEITAGKIAFADAARKHSQSPSADKGGDVGFFPYRGKMPLAFTQVVFAIKEGEVSEPFVTPFGAHLVRVTEEKPGDASLEDVRPAVLSRLSNELWNETLAAQKSKANVRWVSEQP